MDNASRSVKCLLGLCAFSGRGHRRLSFLGACAVARRAPCKRVHPHQLPTTPKALDILTYPSTAIV